MLKDIYRVEPLSTFTRFRARWRDEEAARIERKEEKKDAEAPVE